MINIKLFIHCHDVDLPKITKYFQEIKHIKKIQHLNDVNHTFCTQFNCYAETEHPDEYSYLQFKKEIKALFKLKCVDFQEYPF